jgi:SAM-dependent methyltransferase
MLVTSSIQQHIPHSPRSTTAAPETLSAVIPDIPYYDELALSYESAFSHDPGLHAFIQRALTYLPPKSQVLDIGCGTGKPVSTTMAASGHSVTGIDLSSAMIEQCRAQVPTGTFYQSSMLTWTPSQAPDAQAIFTIFSLFMLSKKELASMLSKMHGWLRDDGVLCLGTICAEDLETRREMWDEKGECASGVEMMFMGSRCKMTAFTKEGWKSMLREAGFEVFFLKKELFVPKAAPGVETDDEMHCFIMAKKNGSNVFG